MRNKGARWLLMAFILSAGPFTHRSLAQCCAGGSGSCMVGGAAQGVLGAHQMELNTNFQYIHSNSFYRGSERASEHTFDSFESKLQYFKVAYGASKNLTVSLEYSHYLLKKETGLNGDPATTYTCKGMGDLIIFPRYNVFHKETRRSSDEVTIGLGYKVPLGAYNDSIGNVEPFSGQTFYVTKPTAVQLSSGAQDLIVHTFYHHGFLRSGLNFFASALYIRKGWNPNGEKMGDFASLAVYGSRTFSKRYGITLQVRYEYADRMRINNNILMFGKPSNYFPEATGYCKWFFTPQVSCTVGKFTLYATTDIPIHQRMNTSRFYTQVGSQHAVTVGAAFRFSTARPKAGPPGGVGAYVCPMHPEEVADGPSRCSKCGMDLEPVK